MTDRTALAERLLGALIGAAELLTIELGRQLGLYAALRESPQTPATLAKEARVDERYAREWLDQQATAGLLSWTGTAFTLPPATAAVLLDETGPDYLGTAGQFILGLGLVTPEVIAAYRTGAGVSYTDYGAYIRHGIAAAATTCSPAGTGPGTTRCKPPPCATRRDPGAGRLPVPGAGDRGSAARYRRDAAFT